MRESRLVRPHEGRSVDVTGRVLAHELAVQLDDVVRRETAPTQQVLHLGARQLTNVTAAHPDLPSHLQQASRRHQTLPPVLSPLVSLEEKQDYDEVTYLAVCG